MADLTFLRRSSSCVALCGLLFTACGGSSYFRTVSVNPADASVFVNGEKIGQGSPRPFKFDFSQTPRIYVQATHPDYQPELEWFTLEKIEAMIQSGNDVKLALRSR